MPLQKQAEVASRRLTAAATALQGCTSLAAALLSRKHHLHEGQSFLPDAASDEERFLSVFVAGSVAGKMEEELASLQRCLEAEPAPDVAGAEELAEALLQRLLSATVSLALDVPVYAKEAGPRVALAEVDRRYLARLAASSAPLLARVGQRAGIDCDEELLLRLARQLDPACRPTEQPAKGAEAGLPKDGSGGALQAYGPALVGLLEELQAAAQQYTDELSTRQLAALPLLARLLDAPSGPQRTPAELGRLLAATPAQRAVLSRAVLSRRFELAAERLQGAGFSLGARQLAALPPPFQSMAGIVRAGHSVRTAHALSQVLALASVVAASLPSQDPDLPAVASLLVVQLLPARTQYMHRALGSRLLPDEAGAVLRLCASAASAVFSIRTPWVQLRAELRREAKAEAALLGTGPIGGAPNAPAGAAAVQDKMEQLVQDVEADLSRLLAPSPTGEGGRTPTTALDLSRLRASGDRHAAAMVVRTVCERALLRRDAAAADELVAASHVLQLAGS